MTEKNLSPSVLSEIYHSLSASRRCYAIQLLSQSDKESLSVRKLAREIAATEQDIAPDCATGEPYRNVYNALSQTHLSTLSDAGIIIYDSDRQTAAAGPNLNLAILLMDINRAAYQVHQRK
jgi:hypothetical protein